MPLSRGRVLSSPSLDAERATVLAPAARRVLPEPFVRASEEAAAITASAREEAEAIVAEARQKAAHARADAEREGRAASEVALAAAWLRLRSAEAEALRAREGQVLAVARLLAERLLGRALALEPSLMADLTREALGSVVRARRVVLHAHPTDAESLRLRLNELGLDAASIEVHDDAQRPRGGLRAETDLGTLDADLAPQLDRLIDALRRA